ncbi:fe2+ zn2+ uptake regulation protein [Pseudomonas mediterranea]|uniref:Fe2+ zn2+ uptake regulation protein n=1 Tax=Pseudomonas mediterranea TaxID=183795 RepID=A0AAX2DE75_9PSED|nr:fe2+ zn2+ uptake regulation protein [Pseudomonas mediterranea]KGU87147.1 fe2+ zn2+ uptake regulation protein [Pseudomonas mediterranea CFBP 5447]MDU9027809.1 fe2+ zn2+ uptake regulation protein [Pseudomonas mediterranea]QHA82587.1 fe2+ zn2+ uptake regulation protein [Pseudomonas mediterranea]UZE03415.1 fe2+ zn2+ uptake regulation protein [Pseudomonas mediterranea]CAH0186988.1 hypothetical protein SRABI112_01553 [Pseudomonas mediterranea]
MQNAQLPMENKPASSGVAMTTPNDVPAKATERGNNDHIRRLLKSFGLRTSLIRLKIIDILLTSTVENSCLGARGVHSQLLALDIPLSFLSVREVLKRLCSEGLVTLNPDKSYSLHPRAMAVLAAGE